MMALSSSMIVTCAQQCENSTSKGKSDMEDLEDYLDSAAGLWDVLSAPQSKMNNYSQDIMAMFELRLEISERKTLSVITRQATLLSLCLGSCFL